MYTPNQLLGLAGCSSRALGYRKKARTTTRQVAILGGDLHLPALNLSSLSYVCSQILGQRFEPKQNPRMFQGYLQVEVKNFLRFLG